MARCGTEKVELEQLVENRWGFFEISVVQLVEDWILLF